MASIGAMIQVYTLNLSCFDQVQAKILANTNYLGGTLLVRRGVELR
ncbi:hypothetical protein RintRC_3644 [Richelia intracellularis]|nr:hypothetical protein RintRC_3644 [Richelia intracellularis]